MKTELLNRVHGDINIKRQTPPTIKNYKQYNDYRPFLEKDFHGICGYCGKNEKLFLEHFQIDHFAPKRFTNLIDDYNNLVFCCPKCNRHKSDKWASDDAGTSIENNQGFIDPATEEYDKHLIRDNNGNIVGRTSIGEYMCRELKFDIRPISLIWKVNKLKKLEERLREDNNLEGLKHHKEVSIELDNILLDLVYNRNE